MFRIVLIGLVALCLACGGEDAPGDAPKPAATRTSNAGVGNRPPVIAGVEITPAEPTLDDALTVTVRVNDPDRDPVDVSYEWYRNGALLDVEEPSVEPHSFDRGDRIQVYVYASDDEEEVTAQSRVVEIRNSKPRIGSVKLAPERPQAGDMLQASVDASDPDDDSLELSYRWLAGGRAIEGEEGPRLAPGKVRKGERVAVQALASDGMDESGWATSNPVAITNAPPQITSQPNYELSGPTRYSYQIRAADPDGDVPLMYELKSGPAGMEVDATSGLVSWSLQPGVAGTFPIELSVSDPYGGEVTQRYSLEVNWEQDGPARAQDRNDDADDEQAGPASPATIEDATKEFDDSDFEFEYDEGGASDGEPDDQQEDED